MQVAIGQKSLQVVKSQPQPMRHIERERGNELLKISNGEPPPRSRPLPTNPFPLSGGTEEEEDCTTAVYEVIHGYL